MDHSQKLPLPQLTEVMVTAELFETVKEAHAEAVNKRQHFSIIRVNGSLRIVDKKQLGEAEKKHPNFQLVYSTESGFIFAPMAGDLVYG